MGQILSSKQITVNNIKTFIENSTKDYSSFLNSAPTFITYYSKNNYESTYDKGFENYNQAVGAESPIKYNKIENLPIYKIENSDFGKEITDFGITANITSSAIILPDTVIPNTDDYFFLFYNNVQKIFVITDVEQDNYNNKKFFKISFKLSTENLDQIEIQKAKDLVVDYEKIGKVNNPVYDKIHYDAYKDIEVIHDHLLDYYNDKFYSTSIHSYVGKLDLNFPIEDLYLNKFIVDKKIATPLGNTYRNFTYINSDRIKYLSGSLMDKTIYGNILHSKKLDDFSARYIYAKAPLKPNRLSRDWLHGSAYYNIIHEQNRLDLFKEYAISVNTFGNKFLDSFILDEVIEDDPYLNFISDYIKSKYTTDNCIEMINKINVMEDIENNYFTIPICLYILKLYHEELTYQKFIF